MPNCYLVTETIVYSYPEPLALTRPVCRSGYILLSWSSLSIELVAVLFGLPVCTEVSVMWKQLLTTSKKEMSHFYVYFNAFKWSL